MNIFLFLFIALLLKQKRIYFLFRKFDLKGSTVDREASDKELEKNLPTLKDNDFIKQQISLCIGEPAKVKLMEMLSADVNVIFIIFLPFFFKQRLIYCV